ncbi:hypothetical protein GQ457_06G022210 [Hibiscus cannabinus]
MYFGLFLSPMPTFARICKNQTVEEFQSHPYLCMLMNSNVWMLHTSCLLRIGRKGCVSAMLCLHSRRALFMRIVADVSDIVLYASPLTIWKKVVTTKSVEYMPFWLSLAVLCNGIYWTIYALVQFDIFILVKKMIKEDLYCHYCNNNNNDVDHLQVSNGVGAIFGAIQVGLYASFYVNGEDQVQNSILPI